MDEFQVEYLSFLAGKVLQAVVFGKDYLQLHFDYATITCYTLPVILGESEDFLPGHTDYKNKLCEFIDQAVKDVVETSCGLVISFDTGELLFRLEGKREILNIMGENTEWYSYPCN